MKHSVYLFQPQAAIDSGDEENYWLPYSAACVWSYAAQFEEINKNLFCPKYCSNKLPNMYKANILNKIWEKLPCMNM